MIGNSNYSTEKTLSTPIPDAITVSESLADIGFNVYVVFDGDKEDMDEAIKKFAGYASGYETALVYYAGHGTQFNGDVFLMPVDAVVETSYDVKDRCVATGRVISFLNEGEGVEQNYKKAVFWYEKAANQGYTEAQHNIGLCYENGVGVEKT